jgi:hypothetical protein
MPSLRANGSRERAPDDRLREAIHFTAAPRRKIDCFVARAPLRKRFAFVAGNEAESVSVQISNSRYTSASRGGMRPRFACRCPSKRGSRECRMRAAPAVPCAKGRKGNAHEHTGQRRRSDIPCAMALRLIPRSPRSIGLSCLRRLPESGTLARSGFRASERLDADH